MDSTTKRRVQAAGVVVALALVVLQGCDACNGPPSPAADAGTGAPTGSTTSAPTTASSAAPTTSATAPPVDTPTYEIDAAGSKVSLTGTAGAEKYSAVFGSVKGVFHMNGADIPGSSFELTLDASSIKAEGDDLTGKLKGEHFLEAERYASETFVSTRFEEAKKPSDKVSHDVSGNLTIHGVLKPLTFPALIKHEEDNLQIKGSVALKRSDFGIVSAGKPEDPLKDSFRLELDLKLVRKQP